MTYQRHPLDIGSLVFGLVFLGGVAVWGLFELDVMSADDAGWLLPVVLVGAGLLGIALAVTRDRRSRETGEPAEEPSHEPAAVPATAADTTDTTGTADTRPIPSERHDD